jgi:hypothetical protein
MWEVCTLQISYETPLEVLEDLKVKIKGYLVTNSREWGGGMQLGWFFHAPLAQFHRHQLTDLFSFR